MSKFKSRPLFIVALLLMLHFSFSQNNFTVTLDAGHGDHDPGAQYHGFVEKDINLAIVLKIGKLLESKPGVTVNYTRKTDVFIGLIERADIANRVDANIFISIHCNASRNLEAFGSETFVMGINKIKSNLEAAKRENSVITLEKDYKKKYQGYDINNPETMIGMTLMQEEFESNSIALAGKVQNKFKNNLSVKSRGVSQAPYMVLHKAYMPRVLIETGFISNEEEGSRLNSEQGQQDIAESVVEAIMEYKKDFFDGGDQPDTSTPTKTSNQNQGSIPKKEILKSKIDDFETIYKIQIAASSKKINLTPCNFKGLSEISAIQENSLYKYNYGKTTTIDSAKELLKKAKQKGYTSAFIVAFKNGKSSILNLASAP